MRKVCIVTPDIIGPVLNGGIGTQCYWLARLYARQPNCKVTVAFTSSFECGSEEKIVDSFAAQNIEFVPVYFRYSAAHDEHGSEWFGARSTRTYEFLRSRDFDVVHFQDWMGNGFIPIQAKAAGLAFKDTLLTVTMHSPRLWVEECMQELSGDPIHDGKFDYVERYSCEHADILISPSAYMFDWAISHGWNLPDNRRVVGNLIETSVKSKDLSKSVRRILPDLGHLAFFGRLETRKGLKLFCDAVNRVISGQQAQKIRKVTFLGKEGVIDGQPAWDYLGPQLNALEAAGIAVDVISDHNALAALRWLKEQRAIAVMPSLQENYPFTVLECLSEGVPFLASNVGGIPEMVNGALFAPDVMSLAEAINERKSLVTGQYSKYCGKRAAEGWLNILDEATRARVQRSTRISERRAQPRVSVCISYYNYGRFLPQLLRSLLAVNYTNMQVVVVNDGSTCEQSRLVFQQQRKMYNGRNWKFVSTKNQGLGAARNHAVKHADGEYIIFMDADNVARSNMVRDFVVAMQTSGADCLTCHYDAFEGEDAPTEGMKPAFSYAPLGPVPGVGILENVFGDANFCIKRDVFLQCGGFTEMRNLPWEDWEFLSTVFLEGFKVDVVPKSLFYYRVHGTSMLRTLNNIRANVRRATAPYLKAKKLDLETLLNGLLVPLNRQLQMARQENSGLRSQLTSMRSLEREANSLRDRIREQEALIASMNQSIVPMARDEPVSGLRGRLSQAGRRGLRTTLKLYSSATASHVLSMNGAGEEH